MATQYFKNYISKLDEVYRQASKTSMLESPPELVKMGKNAATAGKSRDFNPRPREEGDA